MSTIFGHKKQQGSHYAKQYQLADENISFSEAVNLWQWGKSYPLYILKPFFRLIPNRSLLITCCGTARELLLLHKHNIDVTATDLVIEQLGEYDDGGFLFHAEIQDAEALPYGDDTFDYGYINAGLHHLTFPHKGLAELYRVAREAAIFIEAQDSILHSIARVLGRKAADFEPAGNYVYRWKYREIEKFALAAHAHSLATKTIFLPLNVHMRKITGHRKAFFQMLFPIFNSFLGKFGNIMMVFLFKLPPSREQIAYLHKYKFKLRKLHRNVS